jgi:hypothetical protein
LRIWTGKSEDEINIIVIVGTYNRYYPISEESTGIQLTAIALSAIAYIEPPQGCSKEH